MAVVSLVRVRQERVAGGYDLGHLQAFHRAVFGALYPWAGQLRTLDIGEDGDWFHPHHRLKAAGAWAFGELVADGQLRGLDRDGFVSRLRCTWATPTSCTRSGTATPYQRALFGQLAADAGWGLAWERMEPPRNLAASRAAHHAQARDMRFRFVPRALPAGFLGSGECVRPGAAGRRPGWGRLIRSAGRPCRAGW